MKNHFYTAGLVTAMIFLGCESDPKYYSGSVRGMDAVYRVYTHDDCFFTKYSCDLVLEKNGWGLSIEDKCCDDDPDFVMIFGDDNLNRMLVDDYSAREL